MRTDLRSPGIGCDSLMRCSESGLAYQSVPSIDHAARPAPDEHCAAPSYLRWHCRAPQAFPWPQRWIRRLDQADTSQHAAADELLPPAGQFSRRGENWLTSSARSNGVRPCVRMATGFYNTEEEITNLGA